MRKGLIAGLFAAWMSLAPAAAAAGELVMFWAAGCPWCAAWDRDIAAVYPRTEEAKRLPLRRVDLRARRPDDLRYIEGIRFTPTFVAVEDGREYGRIVGYIGEDQFWGLLGQIVATLPPRTD